jgi:hypothetical protein
VDENAGRISGGGVAAHRDTGMAVLLEVGIKDRFAGRAPRMAPLPVQWNGDRKGSGEILQATSTAICVVRKSLKKARSGFDDLFLRQSTQK